MRQRSEWREQLHRREKRKKINEKKQGREERRRKSCCSCSWREQISPERGKRERTAEEGSGATRGRSSSIDSVMMKIVRVAKGCCGRCEYCECGSIAVRLDEIEWGDELVCCLLVEKSKSSYTRNSSLSWSEECGEE
jgi:hypothetical protein